MHLYRHLFTCPPRTSIEYWIGYGSKSQKLIFGLLTPNIHLENFQKIFSESYKTFFFLKWLNFVLLCVCMSFCLVRAS